MRIPDKGPYSLNSGIPRSFPVRKQKFQTKVEDMLYPQRHNKSSIPHTQLSTLPTRCKPKCQVFRLNNNPRIQTALHPQHGPNTHPRLRHQPRRQHQILQEEDREIHEKGPSAQKAAFPQCGEEDQEGCGVLIEPRLRKSGWSKGGDDGAGGVAWLVGVGRRKGVIGERLGESDWGTVQRCRKIDSTFRSIVGWVDGGSIP